MAFVSSFPNIASDFRTAPMARNVASLTTQANQPPAEATPTDRVTFSQEALTAGLRTGPQNLMLFGGDRRTAVQTLVASGAKAENPQLPWYKDALRKIVGGTKTVTRPISEQQSISTKVNVKNFHLKALRLTTETPDGGLRHTDFSTKAPTGKKGQVKDVGQIIGRGQPTRMFEQSVTPPSGGQRGEIENSYYDPKTGKKFLQTSELSSSLDVDKMGAFRSKKNRGTDRQIELLDGQGQVDQRYVFDYGAKSVRLEDVNPQGEVVSTRKLSKKTDYWKTVDRLSLNPPSAQVAATPAPAPAAPQRQALAV